MIRKFNLLLMAVMPALLLTACEDDAKDSKIDFVESLAGRFSGVGVGIKKNIDVHAGYTTIPEYRMSEKRLHAGFDFHVGSLSEAPAASIAVSDAEKARPCVCSRASVTGSDVCSHE